MPWISGILSNLFVTASCQAIRMTSTQQKGGELLTTTTSYLEVLAAKLHKPIVILLHMFKIVDTASMIFSFSICHLILSYIAWAQKVQEFFLSLFFFCISKCCEEFNVLWFPEGFQRPYIDFHYGTVCVCLMQCCLKITTIQYWFPASFLVYWHSFNHIMHRSWSNP